MKKAYWFAPLAALIVFVVLYMNSRVEIEAKANAEKERKAQEIVRKNEENKRATEAAALKRKLDKEEKDRKEAEEKRIKAEEDKQRDDLEYAREFAKREATRYHNVVKDLTEAFKVEQASQKEAEKAIESMRSDKKTILEYVAKAQSNEKALKELLQKLEKLDKDRAEAAKLAAKNG